MTSKIIIPKLKPTTQPLNRPLTPLVSPSVYGTSLMDMFRYRRTGAFNIHDIENFADEYWETEDIKIPEGLDRFLVNRCPESDKELALWMYVCLQNNGLISPFTIRANPMQPNSNSHLDFIADAFFERVGDCIVLGNRFGGKCQGKDTPILMYDGTIKMIQDVVEGDLLMGDDSQPRRVLSTTHGVGPLYKIIPSSGDPYVVNDAHILSLKYAQGARVKGRACGGEIVDIEIEEYLKLGKTHQELLKGYKVPVRKFGGETSDLSLPAYFLGVWLGDGTCKSGVGVTTPEPELVDYIYQVAEAYDLDVRDKREKTTNIEYSTYFFSTKKEDRGWNCHPFMRYFREVGLDQEKFIPQEYKIASWEDRMWLLAGLLDTDGEKREGGKFTFTSKYRRLAEDVMFVARSLGLSAYISERIATCTNGAGGPKQGTYYYVYIGGDTYTVPLRVARKKTQPRQIASNGRRPHDTSTVKIMVEPAGVGDYYGFVIDGNHRYLMGDFTVTHNTLMFAALMFMEALFKPGIELAHLAAIRDQAQNCYTYFLKFANHPLFAHLIKGKPTMSKAVFKNESVVKILIGTVTGVNSPHPCKANIDEAELLPWAILQEAMNMATSTVTARGAKSYKQATRITSTRKKSTGTMQRLLEEAEDRGFKVYKWNVWDTIQRCLIPEDPAIIPVVDEFNDNQIVNVPQSCMGCPMMQMEPPRCLGKARMSNGGVVHLDDIRAKVRNLDNEVWMAQHECSKPGTKDLIYYMFNKGTHVINYEDFLRAHGMEVAYAEFSAVGGTYGRKVAYCPDLPVYAAQDAGYNCPATIFIQEIEDVLYVFDEIRVDRIAPSIYIQDYLLPAHVEYGVEYWICDPNGITLYSDMEVAGLYIVPASNPVEPGIEAVAARLGANQIYFDKSCINCINDLSKYSRDSYGNIRRKTIFHYADCLRYLCMEFVAFSQVLDTVY